MLEVRRGVLLGSLGDALAAITRVASITKVYTITHVLSITNQPLDWSLVGGRGPQSRGQEQLPEKSPPDSCKREDTTSGASDETSDDDGVAAAREIEVGGSVRSTSFGFQSLFVRLPDLPTSDLLHHFEECCRFIREAVESKGTVLVHCEHGVSRSVTVILAYLMWSEGRSFQVLYDELKVKKPEIRPNAGFLEQLKLWGAMRCRLDQSNKTYRAYRLQHLAKDMIDSGYVENLHSSLDPSTNALESTAYFRCRKCRRLLFTEESVLQHELGRGQLAFKWHKRSNRQMIQTGQRDDDKTDHAKDDVSPEVEKTLSPSSGDDGKEMKQASVATPLSPSSDHQQEGNTEGDGGKEKEKEKEERSEKDQVPVPVTPTELAQLRAHLASLVASDSSSSANAKCSSYFVEPVEWMEPSLLGHVEGKILCPKCKGRLGSFNWAGEQCSCGQWVVPSFQIHRSKVDETRTLSKRKPTN